jgi:hypothetical protein
MPDPVAWRVTVETFPGFTESERVLVAMQEALMADKRLSAAASSLDVQSGAVSGTVSIEDPRQGYSMETGIRAFYDALRAAGYDVDQPGWRLLVEAEPLFGKDD